MEYHCTNIVLSIRDHSYLDEIYYTKNPSVDDSRTLREIREILSSYKYPNIKKKKERKNTTGVEVTLQDKLFANFSTFVSIFLVALQLIIRYCREKNLFTVVSRTRRPYHIRVRIQCTHNNRFIQ